MVESEAAGAAEQIHQMSHDATSHTCLLICQALISQTHNLKCMLLIFCIVSKPKLRQPWWHHYDIISCIFSDWATEDILHQSWQGLRQSWQVNRFLCVALVSCLVDILRQFILCSVRGCQDNRCRKDVAVFLIVLKDNRICTAIITVLQP